MMWGLAIGCTLAVGVLWPNIWILWTTRRSVHDDLTRLPTCELGLVLGCAPKLTSGRDNFYFVARMKAAATLVAQGKVKCLIVSGGPLRGVTGSMKLGDSEADCMKAALVELGVPFGAIIIDRTGWRTRRSFERAKEEAAMSSRLTIVSQRFHTPRAVYLAQRLGISAHAFNADSPSAWSKQQVKLQLRESLARTRAFWER